MSFNPFRAVKNRLTAAIDWRAREAARVDEALVRQLGASLANQSVEFTKRIAELERRVSKLEGESPSQ